MRVIVCGGRDFTDAAYVNQALDELHAQTPITTVIQGGAKGADTLAKNWASQRGIECVTFMADWFKYGRSAGPRRNQAMLEQSNPDIVAAFPGGKGTADMVERAKKAGVTVRCYYPEPTGA